MLVLFSPASGGQGTTELLLHLFIHCLLTLFFFAERMCTDIITIIAAPAL